MVHFVVVGQCQNTRADLFKIVSSYTGFIPSNAILDRSDLALAQADMQLLIEKYIKGDKSFNVLPQGAPLISSTHCLSQGEIVPRTGENT